MRRLDRYIFREILTPGLLALVALTFIVFSQQVGMLLEIIVLRSPTGSEIWAVIAALLPKFLTVTIPMGVLVGILTGFSRMSSDSEAIALRASGIPIWRILRPVLVFATLAYAATLVLTVWITPQTTAHLRTMQADLARRYPSLDLKTRIFYEVPNQPTLIYLNDASRQSQGYQGHGILVVGTKDLNKPQETLEVTLAESGSIAYNKGIQLTLNNSSTHVVSPATASYDIGRVRGAKAISFPVRETPPDTSVRITEVTTRELWERIKSGSADRSARAEFHQRIAIPFACIAFALMALPLGVSTNRGGRSMGLVLSLLLMFAYYLVLFGGSRATSVSGFSPVLSAWLPNAVFTVLGIFLLARSDRKHENVILASLARKIERLTGAVSGLKVQGPSTAGGAYSLTFRFRLLRLLDAYVLPGFWFFFTIVLSVFSSLFIVVTLFELLPDIIKNDTPAQTVAIYFLFFLPQIFYWVIPLAVLLAILINLGTLTKTNEVLAIKAGAISLYRMSLPLVLMGALLSGT